MSITRTLTFSTLTDSISLTISRRASHLLFPDCDKNILNGTEETATITLQGLAVTHRSYSILEAVGRHKGYAFAAVIQHMLTQTLDQMTATAKEAVVGQYDLYGVNEDEWLSLDKWESWLYTVNSQYEADHAVFKDIVKMTREFNYLVSCSLTLA